MDPDSSANLQKFAADYRDKIKGSKILEFGSQNINGSCRPHFAGAAEYVGIDILPGPEVDIVMTDHYKFPFDSDLFDFVISANTLEHCRRPWETVKEAARVLKPNGIFFATMPWRIHEHKDGKCPWDCWRILPDGIDSLFEFAGLTKIQSAIRGDQTFAIATKGA